MNDSFSAVLAAPVGDIAQVRFSPEPEVCTRFAIGKSNLWDKIKRKEMVPPVKFGHRSLWPVHELDAVARAILAGVDAGGLREVVAGLEAARRGGVQ